MPRQNVRANQVQGKEEQKQIELITQGKTMLHLRYTYGLKILHNGWGKI